MQQFIDRGGTGTLNFLARHNLNRRRSFDRGALDGGTCHFNALQLRSGLRLHCARVQGGSTKGNDQAGA